MTSLSLIAVTGREVTPERGRRLPRCWKSARDVPTLGSEVRDEYQSA